MIFSMWNRTKNQLNCTHKELRKYKWINKITLITPKKTPSKTSKFVVFGSKELKNVILVLGVNTIHNPRAGSNGHALDLSQELMGGGVRKQNNGGWMEKNNTKKKKKKKKKKPRNQGSWGRSGLSWPPQASQGLGFGRLLECEKIVEIPGLKRSFVTSPI